MQLPVTTSEFFSLILMMMSPFVCIHVNALHIEQDIRDSDPAMMLELYDQQTKGPASCKVETTATKPSKHTDYPRRAETFGELNLGSNFFEGDIRLTNKQRYMLETIWQDGKPQNKDLMKGFRELWFNNTVPYIIAKGLRDVSVVNIRSAIEEWQSKLCISFKERRLEHDYIEFMYGGGCSSNIGRTGGRQVISVGSIGTSYIDMSCGHPTPYGSNVTITCTKGNILHEIGHALGLYHEHSRPDRDQYLTVVWQNVMPGCIVNFRKERFTADNIVDDHYDYNSVMHYGTFFFARERGLRTLRTCMEGVAIGQREKLSALDVQKALSLYQCM